jgi:hypothetical protein
MRAWRRHAGNFKRTFDFSDFFWALDFTQGDHPIRQITGRPALDRLGGTAQQTRQFQNRIAAVGRQIANADSLKQRIAQHSGQIGVRPGQFHADAGTTARQGGLNTIPHDLLHFKIVAEQRHRTLITVEHPGQTRLIQAEQVAKTRILNKGIGVVLIIHRRINVTDEQQQALGRTVHQATLSLLVDFRGKHGSTFARVAEGGAKNCKCTP